MLDERQLKAVYLFAQGRSKSAIAKEVGVNVKTITAWTKKEEFNAEVEKVLERQKLTVEETIKKNIEPIMSKMLGIALTSESEKTSLDACIYLINRLLGTPTAKTQEVTEDKGEAIESIDDILEDIEKDNIINIEDIKAKAK